MPLRSDPSDSVLNTDCRAHEVDNLYVVDASIFPSIGAVNPALTAMAELPPGRGPPPRAAAVARRDCAGGERATRRPASNSRSRTATSTWSSSRWEADCGRTPSPAAMSSTATAPARCARRVADRCSSRGPTAWRTGATSSTVAAIRRPSTTRRRTMRSTASSAGPRGESAGGAGVRRDGASAPSTPRLPVLARAPHRVRALRLRAVGHDDGDERRARPLSLRMRLASVPDARHRDGSTRSSCAPPGARSSPPTSAAFRPGGRRSRGRSTTSGGRDRSAGRSSTIASRTSSAARTVMPTSSSRTPRAEAGSRSGPTAAMAI